MAWENMQTIATIFIKVLKLVNNLIIILLYRYGYGGEFLGVGGTWNLNEEKNASAEVVASGVLVGFFIYTAVVLISLFFGTTKHKRSIVDMIMNVVGFIMFLAVGGIALHYWSGYMSEHKFTTTPIEKQIGLAVGSLCVIESVFYILDTVLSCIHVAERMYGV